ncbi:MAG: hypothetical protein C4547_05845 [Phycisphaerales bacterium]|nr:MAG: hypothetical protein C4547_05845 [Phycisphaerales bacterium]
MRPATALRRTRRTTDADDLTNMTHRPGGEPSPPCSQDSRVAAAITAALSAWILASGAGCTRPRVTVSWSIYPAEDTPAREDHETTPASLIAPGTRVELTAATNEVVTFRVEIAAGSDVDAVSLRPTPLRGTQTIIPAEAVTLYRMHAVSVPSWPGWHVRCVDPEDRIDNPDDVLVPLHAPTGGFPARLSARHPIRVWVDLAVPKGTEPGLYTGAIQLLRAGETISQTTVSLTVWPFELPDRGSVEVALDVDLAALFGHHVRLDGRPHVPGPTWLDDPARGELDAVLWATLKMLQRHRVVPLPMDLTPVAAVNAAGGFDLDWQQYDAVMAPMMDGSLFASRQPLPLCRIPFDLRFPLAASLQSSQYATSAASYIRACADHFRERGWLSRAFVHLPVGDGDAPEAPARMATWFGRLMARGGEAAAVLCPLFPQDMAPYGWEDFGSTAMGEWVDVWAPRAQFYDAGAMRLERLDGRRTWVRLDRPPFSGTLSIAARPADVRAIAWTARRLGAEVVLAGAADPWPPPGADARPQACVDHDGAALCYPGVAFGLNAPVPSARLKGLRRSLQDAALMDLLDQRGLGHVADALAASLVPCAGISACDAHLGDGRAIGWPVEPQPWRAARQIMIDELCRAGERRTWPDITDRDVQWRRFMEATRRVELTCDGARVRPAGAAHTGRMTIELRMTLENLQRTAVSGTVSIDNLPLGWTARAAAVRVEGVQPAARRRVTLVLDASVMSATGDGSLTLPVTFQIDSGPTIRSDARIAYATTQWLDQPPMVDADLSDWPDGIGNVAGGFIQIHDGRTPAEAATLAFVGRDRDALYVAVMCRDAAGPQSRVSTRFEAPNPAGRRSDLALDDLIPVGDDRIELLFDPLNAGTRSPGDLYHAAVFRHGAARSQQGLQLDPQVGRRRPWNADLAAATRETPDGWIAEVRIPLTAFPSDPSMQTVWGFNVLRWDAAEQRFSNWSGARRNAYDPQSLGNLRVP